MSYSPVEQVNHRLYCCRLQLDYYQSLLHEQKLPVAVIESMAGESLIYLLQRAFQAYLNELSLSLNNGECWNQGLEGLVDTLAAEGAESSNITELLTLMEAPDSWLSVLTQKLDVAQEKPVVSMAGDIPLRRVEQPSMLSEKPLVTAFQGLSELIERQRLTSQEW